MRKICIVLLLIVSLFLPVMNEAAACEEVETFTVAMDNSEAKPYAISGAPTLYFKNGRAYCSAHLSSGNREDYLRTQIILKDGKKYLQSWETGGHIYIEVSGSCKVERGKVYTLVQQVYVNGVRHHDHSVSMRYK